MLEFKEKEILRHLELKARKQMKMVVKVESPIGSNKQI